MPPITRPGAAALVAVLAASVALAPSTAPADPGGRAAVDTSSSATPQQRVDVGSAGGLWAPARLEVTISRPVQRVWLQPGTHFVAGDGAVEFTSTRTGYHSPVTTTWRNGAAMP